MKNSDVNNLIIFLSNNEGSFIEANQLDTIPDDNMKMIAKKMNETLEPGIALVITILDGRYAINKVVVASWT